MAPLFTHNQQIHTNEHECCRASVSDASESNHGLDGYHGWERNRRLEVSRWRVRISRAALWSAATCRRSSYTTTNCTDYADDTEIRLGSHAPCVVAVLVPSTESIRRLTQTPLHQNPRDLRFNYRQVGAVHPNRPAIGSIAPTRSPHPCNPWFINAFVFIGLPAVASVLRSTTKDELA
jgi:hypothetical protein